jgi:ABC-type uncharacterized transport system substrate-binding protein
MSSFAEDAAAGRRREGSGRPSFRYVAICLSLVLLSLHAGGGSFGPAAPLARSTSIPRVGFLSPGFPPTWADLRDFRDGLQQLGYVEGGDIIIEPRFAEGQDGRFEALAAELADSSVDVIVATSAPGVRAARNATSTIPIVMSMSSAFGAQEFVASLSQPGGNVTGISRLDPALGGKRLEFLMEAFPHISRAGILWHPDGPDKLIEFEEIQRAGRVLDVDLVSLEAQRPEELDDAFEMAGREGVQGIVVLPGFLTVSQVPKIASLAAERRLPAIYGVVENARAGGLMAYGSSNADARRRLAIYVDKVLKGANPAYLPIEQPQQLQLVINLKTAETLGMQFPDATIAQATEVIQ